MSKQTEGAVHPPGRLTTMREPITLPGDQLVHLQFLRFAGCPICNLHLRASITRADDLHAAGVREVVVFHATRQEVLKHEHPRSPLTPSPTPTSGSAATSASSPAALRAADLTDLGALPRRRRRRVVKGTSSGA